MDKIQLEISFSDNKDGLYLKTDLPEGISIDSPPIYIKKVYGFSEPINMIVYFALGVSAKVAASWLYDKLKDCRSDKITIDRKEIILSEGEITRIIEEKITKG
ncbi:hypothetical protein HQ585_11585 [candidate division KSB1 bacterium]|nr:hypothetical protein [candidate division KSB1 bacterium]